MKKFTLFIVSFLIIRCNLFAQGNYTPFPEDSAQWSIWQYNWDSSGNYLGIVSYQLKMRGDTNINGLDYNKIYKGYDLAYNSPNDSLHCFMRQDTAQRKVWVRYPYNMYNDSSDILLYDFSLQVGDTFELKLVGSGSYYKMQLTWINDSVAYNNIYLREFDFIRIPPPWNLWANGCDGSCVGWTELFGATCNLLYSEIPEGYCLFHNFTTQCIWYKGQYLFGGINCDLNTTISEIASSHEILQIIPNPVKDIATVVYNLRNNESGKLIIVNIMGQVCKVVELKSSKGKTTFELTELSNGVYQFRAIAGDELIDNGKFGVMK